MLPVQDPIPMNQKGYRLLRKQANEDLILSLASNIRLSREKLMEEYLDKEGTDETPFSPKSITLFDDNLDEDGNLVD